MIITRAPLRISLGGGGTDIPSYYEQFGGHIISGAINRYIYCLINESCTSDKIKLSYDSLEELDLRDVESIKHDIIRESLEYYNERYCRSPRSLDICIMSDIEACTGMGSSSSFTVALLAGLRVLNKQPIDFGGIAQDACFIEINRVGKKIGKQDQYISSYGGIQEMNIDKRGMVFVRTHELRRDFVSELEYRMVVFYTGIKRRAGIVLNSQSDSIQNGDVATIDIMKNIHNISFDIGKSLLGEDIDLFGKLVGRHWSEKKKIPGTSSSQIDEWYELALHSGAIGGRLCGAGGGGFLMFVCKNGKRKKLIRAMEDAGLRFMDFRFEFDGVRVMVNN